MRVPLDIATAFTLVFIINAVHAALNLDGMLVMELIGDDDLSLIGDIDAHDLDYYDCLLLCEDYSNPHRWITYLSVERFQRCQNPMLLQLSVRQLLDDPKSTILIRSCSATSGWQWEQTASSAMNTAVPNPKDHNLFRCSLDTAPACFAKGKPCKGILNMASTMDIEETGNGHQAAEILRLMGNSFQQKDNCDESFIFGYHHKFAAGIYIGSGLGKQTAELSLNAMADRLQLN
ncbi:chitinase [Metarhizium brunneum]